MSSTAQTQTPSSSDDNSNPTHKYDPHFTKTVISAMGPNTPPRLRQVMTSLITHLHDFARETDLTMEEWSIGVDMINEAGKMTDDKRDETRLLCDILGLESLVDEITSRTISSTPHARPTETNILGPFYRLNSPLYPNGHSIVTGIKSDEHTYLHGTVTDFSTREAIVGAVVDVWHTAPNGLYEQQDPEQVDYNLRGRFVTDGEGKWALYCLRPTSYPIPTDGPSTRLLKLMDRQTFRPAHIHLLITAPKHKTMITQIFDRTDKFLTCDSVFAVKESLIVDFVPREGDPKAKFEVFYPIKMVPREL